MINIRKNVFETNSSSVHAICISKDKELEAIELLITSHRSKYLQLQEDYNSAKSSLRAIHKIN